MHALRKCYLLLLALMLTTCDGADYHTDAGALDACSALIDKLESCIGARPALRGACREQTAARLLDMSCAEIISEIMDR